MENNTIKSRKHVEIDHFNTALGKEIKVGPKSHATLNKPGFKIEYFTETVSVVIGIGKDHVAELIMDKDAWQALNAGERVDVTTIQQFREKYILKRSKKK